MASGISSAGRRRLLFVTQFYYPDITACAFRMKETVDLLAARGHEVHVIAGEPHKFRVAGERVDDGPVRVTRVPLIKYAGGGKWNYIRHYLSFMFGAIKAGRRHDGPFDAVVATSPPLFAGLAGWVLARRKGARFVLDIRDIWPESAVVTGQLSGTGLLFRSAKVVEKVLYRSADLVTCVASPMADYIAAVGGISRPIVIYNGIPQTYVDQLERLEQCASPDSADLEILYVGNMGYCQNLGLVLDAAALLQASGEGGIRFRLVGEGVERAGLEKRCAAENLRNVVIQGAVPKAEAVRLMGESSALLLLLKDDGTMDKTIPSKVFDYLAAGRPVLFGLKGEAKEIFARSGGNLPFDPASAPSLAQAVRGLQRQRSDLRHQARDNRQLVRTEFLRERMVDRLEASLEKLFL